LQRWRWSRCGLRVEKGLGSFLPPAERASAGFRRFRGNEMPIFHCAGSRKRNGGERGHRSDRTLHRTLHRTRSLCVRRVRSVLRRGQACERGFATGASGDSRDRRVRSCEQRFTKTSDAVRVRSHTIGRVRSSRELTGLPPDAGTVASGQFFSASGRCFAVRGSVLTGASGGSRDRRVRS
jgi:hypothetical protein